MKHLNLNVFRRRALGVHLEHWCAQSWKKGGPETLTKNGEQSDVRLFEQWRVMASKATWGPLKLVSFILQGTSVDIVSLHFVPQGHGGGSTIMTFL